MNCRFKLRAHALQRVTAAALLLAFLSTADRGEPPLPAGAPASIGVQVNYQLPMDGPLPRTYRVTLAAVDARDPNWIISTFASGVVRTVTAANQGRFTETWDGLDDNFMPTPPGTYGLKGIYMPADRWPIDGQYHTIVPKLAATGGSWGQAPSEDALPGKVEGDPCRGPLRDVDIAADGKGVVYFQYLENGTNAFLTDFTRPVGYGQILAGHDTGSVGGGSSACTDGKQMWIVCDLGHQFILHADGTPFGTQSAPGRDKVYLPEGRVSSMSAWPQAGGPSIVFLSERGKIVQPPGGDYVESNRDFTDQIVALDGNTAALRATWKVNRPLAVKAKNGKLYVLHGSNGRFEVLGAKLGADWPHVRLAPLFSLPRGINPFDIEVDSHGRVYISDSNANHVFQFDARGNLLRTYGRLSVPQGGTYDPASFLSPEKLACWTDAQGRDRLLVVEQAGPNRLSEWSGDDGRMIRQWVVPQTNANNGYAIDPRHPDRLYIQGQRDTLVRWKIDYTTGQWTADAVWFHVGDDTFGGKLPRDFGNPRLIYHGNDLYLAFGQGYAVYHFEGDRCRPCAALLTEHSDNQTQYYLWRDLNGDGQVQPDEYLPYRIESPPPGLTRYFGDTWFDDLSLVCIGMGTPDIWRLAPQRFDRRGTPLFNPNGWKKLLTDTIAIQKKAKTAIATHGGNEMVSNGFDCAWASVTSGSHGDVYVDARMGPDFSANNGAQFKLSRYVPDGRGGYVQRWRVGRMAIQGIAKPGEVYGSIYVYPPLNGLVSIVDSARAGMEIYTEDGLYVDTLFPDDHLVSHDKMGAYWQPGEFFGGCDYLDRDNGKIYIGMGKTMPEIYEAKGWTATENSVHVLTTLDRSVVLTANRIASPPEVALQIRGGPAAARVARFYPAPGGGPSLDGSMRGWEACDPIQFGPGNDQSVEARCFYDPEHLYLRWHARLGHEFEARRLEPVQHLFAHDRRSDTLGLYLQGDASAAPGGSHPGGRPGDVRFIFGIFKDDRGPRPVVLGMYPSSHGTGASPVTYTTSAGGSATFADVALVPDVKTGCKIDADGRGFVLAAAIPRTALPGVADLNGWHTQGNFDANLGGSDRFWWSNTDRSASRETLDEPTEARFYPGSWSQVQFPGMDALPIHAWMAIGPFGSAKLPHFDILNDRNKIIETLLGNSYPPETTRDMSATYQGGIAQTRVAAHHLAWKEVNLSGDLVDFGTALGWGDGNEEGSGYLLTHIYSPQAVNVTFQFFETNGQHFSSGQLNGAALPTVIEDGYPQLKRATPLALRAGWNELLIRHTMVWGGNSLGGKLVADPSVLWKLRISGPPPVER